MSEQKSRLADSASPYLRSAAHQPVNWYEWGEEAFSRARSEDKPILLDIGAVWCHWCHVIDRESYENPEIAALINKLFIPVKVDRDERPDVDARYQAAISAVSGQGGWPLTGFLMPDGRPFFGGTYFPPEDAMGRPGFKRIMFAVWQAYTNRREDVEKAAVSLEEAVSQAEVFRGARETFDSGVVAQMVDGALSIYDSTHGGFGRAPKFPHPQVIDLLLELYQESQEQRIREIVEHSLLAMARGGVYDQLAGGFHRYSVDERWLVPHFEKMSYDNSELLKNYVHGWQVTGNPFFREIAEGIVGWVNQTLSDQVNGGFYASQDADYSLDDDGDYFTWTLEELRAALSPDEARVAELRFDVEAQGEMHHNPAKNVLWIAREPAQIAHEIGHSEAEVGALLATAMQKLLETRTKRTTPVIDTTLYVSWNAMFVSAYLDAARAIGGEFGQRCRVFALKALDRLLASWDDASGFPHRLGGPRLHGSLDDQVCMSVALLDAYESTLEQRYFAAAELTMARTLVQYWDAEEGGFFDRGADAPAMGGMEVRRKPLQDSPTPAGNSVAAIALSRLYAFTGKSLYRERAQATLEAFAGVVSKFGMFAASYGLAAMLYTRGAIQVIVTGAADDASAQQLERIAEQTYRFGKAVLRITRQNQSTAWLAPSLAETVPNLSADTPAAFVCVETTCRPPVAKPEELRALLVGSAAGAATS
ncbi:MAG TPA: thioredoxin domain-containing protein [Candidatus Acidoferrales bacterium]|nr:thioredoxin domain-containing protein [Candidatus Acidoferrales bacterium]